MTQLILNATNNLIGYTQDDQLPAWDGVRLLPAPEGFDPALLAYYEVKTVRGKTSISLNMDAALSAAKATRSALIKQEAAALLAATDWKLQRAQERDSAGWGSLAEIDTVLTEREAIRRSSSAAELAVATLADIPTVQSYTWSVSVNVPAPNRLTRGEFLDRFTREETAAILAAADNNASLKAYLKAWIMRLENSDWIKPSEAAPGLAALEIAGLLAAGRAQQILA